MTDFGASGASGASPDTELSRGHLLQVFGVAIIASIGLGMVPWGGIIIYPFRLFTTWAHEMGHGIGAIVTGNSFQSLDIYRSLGGQALISGADGIGQVIVSSFGLIGPAVLGAAVMIAGSRVKTAPFVLGALAAAVALSALLWIRNGFGFFAMLAIAGGLAAAARFASPVVRVGISQLLAVQLALAAWSNRNYLFTKGFERDGRRLDSDTQNIADELFLPYWFWGALLGGVSLIVLVWAFWFAWLRPKQSLHDR